MPNQSSQQAMTTLTAQWYNALVAQLNLDASTFQLIQASAPLGTTSPALWSYFDAVPPAALAHNFNPSQLSDFSQIYGAVVMNLKPQNAATFLQVMGDYYTKWAAYLAGYTGTLPSGGMTALFNQWAQIHIPDPATAQAAMTAYLQIQNGVVSNAVSMYSAARAAGGGYAYNGTYAQIQTALPSAPASTVTLNTATASSDVSHAWASDTDDGIFSFFSGGDSSYDHLAVQLASAGLVMKATFQHVMSFAAGPLNQPSSDPILSGYTPWYNSAALALAYGTQDNTVWNNTPPTWNTTFGPNGDLQRLTTGLVIVDGVTITITSSASFSSSDQQQFQQASSSGFWPFYQSSQQSGWTSNVQFGEDGTMQATVTSPAGNPQVLGAIVTPIGHVLGAESFVRFTAIPEAAHVG